MQAGIPTVSLALVDWHLLLTHHINPSWWGNQGKYDKTVTRKNLTVSQHYSLWVSKCYNPIWRWSIIRSQWAISKREWEFLDWWANDWKPPHDQLMETHMLLLAWLSDKTGLSCSRIHPHGGSRAEWWHWAAPPLHFLHCVVFERRGDCVTLISPGGQSTGQLFFHGLWGSVCSFVVCEGVRHPETLVLFCFPQACTLERQNCWRSKGRQDIC